MEKRKFKNRIVYNLEPEDYSKDAVKIWIENGFEYIAGGLNHLKKFNQTDRIEVLIVRLNYFIDFKIINLTPRLKYIISATTGTNHIDLDYLNNNDIKLITLKGQNDFLKNIPSTAELTWGILLNITRNISLSIQDVKKGNWDRDKFKGFQLMNKNIGIIGLGRICLMVANYAKAFKMNVLYNDINVTNKNFKKCELNELFSLSDIITIHIHSSLENNNLIGENLLKNLKKGTYIINTSRGEIIDEEAVYKYIKNGIISGIATDVIRDENKNLDKSILWLNREDPRILICPHIGGATYDAMWQCELFTQKLFMKNASLC